MSKKVSVALAAYNGGDFITEQLSSILSQLGEEDEVIVSDDNPPGNTKPAVLSLADKRIKYYEGPGKGVVKNFEFAISKCEGDVIFLSDQDDVWLPGKVEAVVKEINGGASLVLHNAIITDRNLNADGLTAFSYFSTNKSFLRNFIKNTFVGCCMAFPSCEAESFLPFPESLPMHDWYIALKTLKSGKKVSLIEEPLILYRRHGGNVTGGRTSLKEKLRRRKDIAKAVFMKGNAAHE
ncbi:MAG: glycosyltransferase [Clostridiales bacterium]|nr:glycosyltransferase [Clostridiales bacterium]